jgi:predicted transcriptional regulator
MSVLLLCSSVTFAQTNKKIVTRTTKPVTTSSNVKVTEDKYSGKRRVTLSSRFAEDLSFTIDKEFDVDSSREIYVSFVFTISNDIFNNAKDAEFNFLVDSVRVKGGKVTPVPSYTKSDTKEVIGTIKISEMEKIAKGSKVEMKFVGTVYILDAKVKRDLLAFVAAVRK